MNSFSELKLWLRLVALTVAVLLSSGTAWAQQGTTSIFGEVTDPQGAAVVGAKVTLTSVATGAIRTTETDSVGRYQFLALFPGTYNLRVEMTGFRTAVREKIELFVNTTSKLNVGLEIGAITETVVVTEAAAALNTTDASLGNVLTPQQVQNIPLEARSVIALLSLQPGATFIPSGDMRSGSISGSRSDQTNITLDGVDLNDPQNQTEAYQGALRVSAESLQEFRVSTSNYGADQGRSSAGQVGLITKSGTNEIHGSLYWYHRNTATSSNEYFHKLNQVAGGQPNRALKLNKHVYGGAGGGPLVKDRLFIFANVDALRLNSETSGTRSVPSLSLRDGVLIYRCRNLAGFPACPTTTTTVMGLSTTHTVPAGHFGLTPAQFAAIDPLGIGPNLAATAPMTGTWRQYPTPNAPGRDGLNIVGFEFGSPIKNVYYSYIAKVDYKLDRTGNHSLYWAGTLQDDFIAGEPQFPGQPPSTVTLINPKRSVVGYTAVINPRWVNTFRWGYLGFKQENAGQRNSSLSTFRFLSHVTSLSSTSARIFQTQNLVNDVSYTRGNHAWQFGLNFRFSRLPRNTNASSFHDAIANGSWLTGVGRRFVPGRATCTTPGCTAVPAVLGGGVAVYADTSINLWGILSQGTARYNYRKDGSLLAVGDPVRRRYASNEYEWYVQDTWRFRPNLTVTLGVRHSIYSPPWETNGNQVAPNPSFGAFFEQRRQGMLQGIPSNLAPRISFDLAGPANGRVGFYEWDYNNFSPRISVAYTPRFSSGPIGWLTGNGKMVIRAGYSLVYDRIGQALATTFDAAGGSFGMSTLLLTPFGSLNESTAPRFTGYANVPTNPAFILPAPPGGFPQTPPFGLFAITNSIDDTNKTPYAHMFNLAIGRELPGGITFEAAYVGRRGRKLLAKQDLAMPLDLVDPVSGTSYFQAATQIAILAEGNDPRDFSNPAPTTSVTPIPYWENLFPNLATTTGGFPVCDVDNLGGAFWATASSTQYVYDLYLCVAPDYTTGLQLLDQDGTCQFFGTCSRFGSFAFFHDQYASLAGQSTLGFSEYHALQITARKRLRHGLQFDVNYTLSKSLDLSSDVERGGSFGGYFGGGYSEFLVNSWSPRINYGHSTFDIRNQINVNWLYELPFGRNRWLGKNAPAWANHVIGDWNVAGLWRWTGGLPFSIINCRSCWPTNWNLQGNASLAGTQHPVTQVTRNTIARRQIGSNPIVSDPAAFANPSAVSDMLRRSRPGEAGFRNAIRGDGVFTIDVAVIKSWNITENHKLRFRWETFNLTNTPRFDVAGLSVTPDISASFGRYNNTHLVCDGAAGRCMQFSLRYEF